MDKYIDIQRKIRIEMNKEIQACNINDKQTKKHTERKTDRYKQPNITINREILIFCIMVME